VVVVSKLLHIFSDLPSIGSSFAMMHVIKPNASFLECMF
jgi:hypothetical protein